MTAKALAAKVPTNAVEIASVASITAVAILAELHFGIYSQLDAALSDVAPWLRSYIPALFGGLWIGLYVYTRARKRELKREIALRKDTEQAFEDFKITDPVTGLPNRYAFDLVTDERLRGGSRHRCAMLAIEVVNLDSIAVVHGRAAAAQLMMALAGSIFQSIAETDYVASDRKHFYLFAADADGAAAQARIEAMIGRILQQVSIGQESHNGKLHATLGFALVDFDTLDGGSHRWTAKDVLRRLDFLLHRARRKGHGAVVRYEPDVEDAMHSRTLIEACLADAIRDRHIVPYFQPLIDLESGQIAGLEVLSRWTHPLLGPVAPSVFVPIAEETGLLGKLTLSIVRQACRAALDWPAELKLAINISPGELRDAGAVDALLAAFRETGIDLGRVELEITENALIEDVGVVSGALSKLKEHGISIAIDDFGTGYSSLFHLRSLPFDKIKIDQSFVQDMATCSENHKIVRTVIALAKSLGLKTTAEGVEGREAETLLQDLGCSIGQGYLFARPLPASDVMDFVEAYSREQEQKRTAVSLNGSRPVAA